VENFTELHRDDKVLFGPEPYRPQTARLLSRLSQGAHDCDSRFAFRKCLCINDLRKCGIFCLCRTGATRQRATMRRDNKTGEMEIPEKAAFGPNSVT